MWMRQLWAKTKVVLIRTRVEGSKRQRVRVEVSKEAGIELQAGPVPDAATSVPAAAEGERQYWFASDHTVGVLAPEAPKPSEAVVMFSGFEELPQSTAGWPMPYLVSVWNQLPGNAPVNRFENRRRLWHAIGKLAIALPQDATESTEQDKPKQPSKTKCVIDLLQAPATAGEVIKHVLPVSLHN